MRIGLIADSLWERLLLRLGVVPTPIAETHLAFLQARAVMTAAEIGLFDALREGPRQPGAIAAACSTDEQATRSLLQALEAARYLRASGDGYALLPKARRWLLADSPTSIAGKMAFHADEWDFVAQLPAFVRSGEAVDIHARMRPEAWHRYHAAMADLARLAAPEIVRRTPVPRGARRLLDLGGAHGVIAAAFCARYEALRAEVLDLPAALPDAPLAAVPGGMRVEFRPGDARIDDLGTDCYDIVLLANVAHHLSDAENIDLAERASRALRPGGTFVVVEWLHVEGGRSTVPLLDLYFALTSQSGTWSEDDIQEWQRTAGLQPGRTRHLRTLPGCSLLPARRR